MTTIPRSAVRQESLIPCDENCALMPQGDRETDRSRRMTEPLKPAAAFYATGMIVVNTLEQARVRGALFRSRAIRRLNFEA